MHLTLALGIGGIRERKLSTRGGSSSEKGGALKGGELSADSIRTKEGKSQAVKTDKNFLPVRCYGTKRGKSML